MPHSDPEVRAKYYRDYYLRNKNKLDDYRRKWAETNPEKEKRYKSKWLRSNLAWYYEWERGRNPIIRKAYVAVRNAIKSGKLLPRPCAVCGRKKTHAHHRDYLKPLDVEWLCPKHHKEKHNEQNS